MSPLYLNTETTIKLFEFIDKMRRIIDFENHDLKLIRRDDYDVKLNKEIVLVNLIPYVVEHSLRLDAEIKEKEHN